MEIALIPDSAPFTAEQRAWLNGFLAGWLGITGQAPPQAVTSAAALAMPAAPPAPLPAPAAAPEPEATPWHDPSLSIDERLKLAEGRPLADRLMAAMAQLDCGACGYDCRTYSQAIADGSEPRLTLCSPGGTETSKALKKLIKEQAPAANGTPKHGTNGVHVAAAAAPSANGTKAEAPAECWTRENPFPARLLKSVNLNGQGSAKETRHVEIDLAGGPEYEVGDSLGVYPENCGELVDALVGTLGASGDEVVRVGSGVTVPLREALARHCCLTEVTDPLLETLAGCAGRDDEVEQLRHLADDAEPIAGDDVLDVLRRFPSARPEPSALVAALSPLRPRLYSISSSPKRHIGQVHLTVRRVAYDRNGRLRKGVASTMLADRVAPGSDVRVFVHRSHGFTVPADPDAPTVMIGPGTGIAPFRAFLHERDATGARGKNWLVFGDQRRATDFLYEDELTDFQRRGVLTRLDTAFSRDGGEKVYVQHRLIEHGRTLLDWLESGAHVFVCGDAKRMASDVDKALHQVVQTHGAMSGDAAKAYVQALTKSGRYRRDVY
jgi:sulfite reductase (NADPH) flavoprotein alpha-component